MKRKLFVSLLIIIVLSACSNNDKKVDKEYRSMQYSIIKGMNASQEGRYSEAINHFLKAYQIDPKVIDTLRELGYNYGATGDYVMAERFYREALKVSPNDSKVALNLGTIYFNQKRYEDSLKIISGVNIENMTLEIRVLRAYNFYALKQYDEAYKLLKELESQKRDDVYFAKVYGDVLLATGKLGELHPFITKLYNEKPSNPEIAYIYGKHLYYNLGKTKEAFEAFDRYIIDYGIYKELNLEAAKISCDVGRYDLGKRYLDLLPDKVKYEEDYLTIASKVYEGLNDQAKVKEITAALKIVKKEWFYERMEN